MITRRGARAGTGADQRGLAMVELALVIPFLALVVFGTIDLGRVYQLQTRLQNAAREGARLAQFAPEAVVAGTACADPDNITWAANHEEGVHSYAVVVQKIVAGTPTTITGCRTPQSSGVTVHPGDRVRVRVSTTFTPITPIARAFVSEPFTITGSQEVVVQG